MSDATRHGRSIAMLPMEHEDAPASRKRLMPRMVRTPPPALIGFVIPISRARLTQLVTIGSSGAPERPPGCPTYAMRGEIARLPKSLSHGIYVGKAPNGIVFETQSPAQNEEEATSRAISMGVIAESFTTSGTSKRRVLRAARSDSVSSATCCIECGVLGQDIFTCSPNGARKFCRSSVMSSANVIASAMRSSGV